MPCVRCPFAESLDLGEQGHEWHPQRGGEAHDELGGRLAAAPFDVGQVGLADAGAAGQARHGEAGSLTNGAERIAVQVYDQELIKARCL